MYHWVGHLKHALYENETIRRAFKTSNKEILLKLNKLFRLVARCTLRDHETDGEMIELNVCG